MKEYSEPIPIKPLPTPYNQMACDRNLTRPCPQIGKAKTIPPVHYYWLIHRCSHAATMSWLPQTLKCCLSENLAKKNLLTARGRLREHVMNWDGHSQLQDIAKLSAMQTNWSELYGSTNVWRVKRNSRISSLPMNAQYSLNSTVVPQERCPKKAEIPPQTSSETSSEHSCVSGDFQERSGNIQWNYDSNQVQGIFCVSLVPFLWKTYIPMGTGYSRTNWAFHPTSLSSWPTDNCRTDECGSLVGYLWIANGEKCKLSMSRTVSQLIFTDLLRLL